MTPEELDKATGREAWRQWLEGVSGEITLTVENFREVATVAARLRREGWTPPKPVDPDVQAFRKWRAGAKVGELQEPVDAYLAGARMAREQEQERAKVLTETLEAINEHYDIQVRKEASNGLAAYRAGKEAAR